MRERPALSDESILAAAETHYGISVSALTFLPLGNDSATSVYRVQAAQMLPQESFTPSRRNLIPALEAAVHRQHFGSDVESEFAAVWQAHAEEIRTVVERADPLAGRLRQDAAPLVLCHADMHPWNLLIDDARQLWLVDWDETVLARKERDLMFLVGGIGGDRVGPHETACFFEGYGETEIDAAALAYYRCAWAVQDIAAYGEQILFLPDLGEESRREAVQDFKSLFAPGRIVSLALDT